jgi:hypothetical protein
MFGEFLTLMLSIFPFFKELILGNQTVRDAFMHNKLVVLLGILFLFMIGSNLYIDDTAKYLKLQVDKLNAQIAADKVKVPVPGSTLLCPAKPIAIATTPLPILTPTPAVAVESPAEQLKDTEINTLKSQLQQATTHPKATKKAPVADPLDKLYSNN